MSFDLYWEKGIEFVIDPDDTLSYTFIWSDWLAEGATIATYEIVSSAGVTVEDSAIEGSTISVSVSGVALGARETVTCRVTTAETIPQQADRSITLRGVTL